MSLLETVPGVEQRQGCPVEPVNGTDMCFGPRGTYWTVFGSEAPVLVPHFVGAIITGFLIFGLLHLMDRKEYAQIPRTVRLLAGILTVPVAFLVYTYLFPVTILY